MNQRPRGPRALLPEALTALALLVAPFVLPKIGLVPDTMNRILVFGLFGVGFDLLFGYAGMLSFGQAAFFGTGGFIAAYLLTQMGLSSVMLGLAIGTVGAAVAGYLVGLIALRRTGIYFAMITVAIGEVFFFMENGPLSSFTGGENGLPGVPAPTFNLGFATIHATSGWSMYGFLGACYLVGIVIARRIVASPVGLVWVAIRENPLRAAAVGHNVHAYKLLAFVIAAAYSGFAGGLLGVMQGYMPPDAFTFDTSGQVIMMTVIGGLRDPVWSPDRRGRMALPARLSAGRTGSWRFLEARARPRLRPPHLIPETRNPRRRQQTSTRISRALARPRANKP